MKRRDFIKASAGVLGSGLIGPIVEAQQQNVAPAAASAKADQIRVGVIGVGSRGQQDMRSILRVPGVRITALCDIYEPRFDAGRELTGENTPTYTDYRKMLESRDVDAVLVATPLHLHAEHAIAALESGRHVYGEKAMGKTAADCDRIAAAVKRTGRHFQVGTQYHYAPGYIETARRIAAGDLGKVTHIYAFWHRNDSWRRPVPGNDPKLERLINWRLYREYSGGLMAELASHQIEFANRVFGAHPVSVIGSGGLDYWKDGRDVDDNVDVIFRYPGGESLSFSSVTTNRLDGAQERVLGTRGSIVLTHADATYYYEQARAGSASGTVVEHGVVTGATFRSEVPYRGAGAPIRIPDGVLGNADYLAFAAFFDALRNNTRPEANEDVGWAAGVAVALANQAIEEGRRITFPKSMGTA